MEHLNGAEPAKQVWQQMHHALCGLKGATVVCASAEPTCASAPAPTWLQDTAQQATADQQQQEGDTADEPSFAENGAAPAADDRLPHNQWQGQDIQFMQSNAHARERQGKWDTSGLEGAALQIVEADEKAAK